jgi:hypothetical protein
VFECRFVRSRAGRGGHIGKSRVGNTDEHDGNRRKLRIVKNSEKNSDYQTGQGCFLIMREE